MPVCFGTPSASALAPAPHPSAAQPPATPDGWEQRRDPHGNVYYYHAITGMSTPDPPVLSLAASPQPPSQMPLTPPDQLPVAVLPTTSPPPQFASHAGGAGEAHTEELDLLNSPKYSPQRLQQRSGTTSR